LREDAKNTTLRIHSPAGGVARVLNLHGRVLLSFALASGRQSIALQRFPMGRYLLQAVYVNATQEVAAFGK
jgi:hypothetical protein